MNPAKFVREVRQEMKRVVWPTRKETTVSTIMVLLLVSLASVLFLIIDSIAGAAIRAIIGL